MRKPTSVEVMLLSAIALWALNLTVSRYILTHGFQPLSYSTVRYGLASLVFIAIALVAVDDPITADVSRQLRELPGVLEVVPLSF